MVVKRKKKIIVHDTRELWDVPTPVPTVQMCCARHARVCTFCGRLLARHRARGPRGQRLSDPGAETFAAWLFVDRACRPPTQASPSRPGCRPEAAGRGGFRRCRRPEVPIPLAGLRPRLPCVLRGDPEVRPDLWPGTLTCCPATRHQAGETAVGRECHSVRSLSWGLRRTRDFRDIPLERAIV